MEKLEINIVPKFIDEAVTPVAKNAGNTISGLWNLTFGNHVSLWLKKQEYKHQLNYKDFVEKINHRFDNIPTENIKEPEMYILGPAIESSKYYIDSEILREMFANLISSSVDSTKTNKLHPSFVEIIKQLSPDEAKIVKLLNNDKSFPLVKVRISDKNEIGYDEPLVNFSLLPFTANCENPELGPSYIDNLCRLGIITTSYTSYKTGDNVYEPLFGHDNVNYWIDVARSLDKVYEVKKGVVLPTEYGKKFIEICVS